VTISFDIVGAVPRDDVPLYVRLPADQAQRLHDVADSTGQSKRRLVEDAVRQHLAGDDGLVVGRAALREDAPEVLTLEEAAALLRVEDAALLAIAEQEDVPGQKIGQQWRFSRAALLAWLDPRVPRDRASRPQRLTRHAERDADARPGVETGGG
jgi:excisionase family DNA binding protein